AERLQYGREPLRHRTVTDETDGLATDLAHALDEAGINRPTAPGACLRVDRYDAPQACEQQRERHLDDRLGVGAGHVADGDTAGLCRLDIDGVYADPDLLNQTKPRSDVHGGRSHRSEDVEEHFRIAQLAP